MQFIIEASRFVTDRRINPRLNFAKLLPALKDLSCLLERVNRMEDKINAVVNFFDIVSRWHDREAEMSALISEFEQSNFQGKYSEVLENLRVLRHHFQNAGRSMSGWNRTSPGMKVSDENVFLGGIYGLFTHPVSVWKEERESPKGGSAHFGGSRAESDHNILSDQAERFMISHIGPMREIIGYLSRSVVERD